MGVTIGDKLEHPEVDQAQPELRRNNRARRWVTTPDRVVLRTRSSIEATDRFGGVDRAERKERRLPLVRC